MGKIAEFGGFEVFWDSIQRVLYINKQEVYSPCPGWHHKLNDEVGRAFNALPKEEQKEIRHRLMNRGIDLVCSQVDNYPGDCPYEECKDCPYDNSYALKNMEFELE